MEGGERARQGKSGEEGKQRWTGTRKRELYMSHTSATTFIKSNVHYTICASSNARWRNKMMPLCAALQSFIFLCKCKTDIKRDREPL